MTLEQFIGEDYKFGPHESKNYLETAKQMVYAIVLEEAIEDCNNRSEAKVTAKAIVSDMDEEDILEKLQEYEEQ